MFAYTFLFEYSGYITEPAAEHQQQYIRKTKYLGYRIYHMYSDRQAWANSIDPDKTPQNASHLGVHCLPLIQHFLDTTSGSELYWFKF